MSEKRGREKKFEGRKKSWNHIENPRLSGKLAIIHTYI